MIERSSAGSHALQTTVLPLRMARAKALFLAAGMAACGSHGQAAPPAGPPAPIPSASVAVDAASFTPTPSSVPAPTAMPGLAAPPPPPNPRSTKVTVKNDPAWAACHRGYEATKKDPARDVAAMAARCAKSTQFKLVGKPLTGKQSDRDAPQSFPLKAEANHCYRVYGQASEGIKDLDLAVKDSTGAVAGEDSTDDPSPVIAEDGALCFKEADTAMIVVSVGMGSGTYALEIWRD